MKRISSILILLFFLAMSFQPSSAASDEPLVLLTSVDGPISPAIQEYISRSIDQANQQYAEVLIIQLNTPGGAIDVMNNIIRDIRASSVPIVVYISPRGAMAASAGTLITLSGHLSAMTPETIIGAASPVDSQGADLSTTLKAKEMEALKATARTLTENRSAEATSMAEATIDKARAVSANEAYQAGLVDFIATDLDDLLTQLDGQPVNTAAGQRVLVLDGAHIETIPMTFIETILQMLTNPNFVFVLLSIGVQAIFIELSSPGGWVAGFIGITCMAVAGYGMGILSVNWFGLLFIVIAIALFILDIKAPTHGALTAAGIGSFIAGSLVLFNSPGTPQFQKVSLPLVILVSALTGLMFAFIVGLAIRAQKTPVRTGHESLVGRQGYANSDISLSGQVQVGGELWTARLAEGSKPIKKGDRVSVVKVEGLHILVQKE
jgi:membrane-bound serine protease (ClpP class)